MRVLSIEPYSRTHLPLEGCLWSYLIPLLLRSTDLCRFANAISSLKGRTRRMRSAECDHDEITDSV